MKNYIKKIEQQVKERMSKPVKKEKVSDKKGFMIPKEVGKKEKELPADDMDLIVDAIVVVRKMRNKLKETGDNKNA